MLQAATRREITKDDLKVLLGDDTAARAIDFAGKYQTPVSPHVYEVWYTYSERSHRALNDALDYAMNTGQQIGAEFLEGLYQEHLSPRSMSDQMNDINVDLTSAIGNVSDAVTENLKENKEFTGALRHARQHLMQGSSKTQVSDVIKNLHHANQNQIDATKRLGMQLEKNRAQVSKLKGELIEARRMSNTDYVTGLPNRRLLDEELDKSIFECRQRGRELSVIMGAVDNLDQVGDKHGLSIGDNVLRSFAEHLQRGLRTDQLAARSAGRSSSSCCPAKACRPRFESPKRCARRFAISNGFRARPGRVSGPFRCPSVERI